MTGIEQDVAAAMAFEAVEKRLKRYAVVKILSGMDFKTQIDSGLVKGVEDRFPTFGEFVECSVDKAGGTLRPGIKIGPRERSGECYVNVEAQVGGSFGGETQLFDSPRLASRGRSSQMLGRKTVERLIVGWVDSHQLTLEVGRKLGDFHAVCAQHGFYFVAV